MIVLSGDHGESLGEHGEKTHGFFIYNATLHVPVIIHVPEAASAKTVSEPVSLADLMPTVLGILKWTSHRRCRDAACCPADPKTAAKTDEDARNLYAETFLPRLHFNWSELRGVETENYHFIDAPKPELYDLSKDPGRNPQSVSAKKGCRRRDARHAWILLIRQYSAGQELAEKTGLDPALMERLKSLGYAGFLRWQQSHHQQPRFA